MQELTQEDLKGLQSKSLEMAKYFKAFCEKHDLTFYFCGGCCIGAVRTGGFIPWDDDVDVFMPRESYERLRELWPEHADSRYQLVESDETFIDHDIFVAIRDAQTTFIKPYQRDIDLCHGLVLDVLPLDGCPMVLLERSKKLGRSFTRCSARNSFPKSTVVWLRWAAAFCWALCVRLVRATSCGNALNAI